MGNNSFLENLKNAVDTGEFNSEVAKKINDISKLAENKSEFSEAELIEKVEKRIGDNVKTVSEEEVAELNSSYEQQMKKIKQTDAMNKQLAMLIEIEEMVELSINDMVNHMDVVMETFEEEHEEKNAIFEPLFTKVEEIRKKYSTFINK
jgi:HAMP domain-containing protein